MLAGKLAAEVVAERAAHIPHAAADKLICPEIYERAASIEPMEPMGIQGDGAIAFGGGAVLDERAMALLEVNDPKVLGL